MSSPAVPAPTPSSADCVAAACFEPPGQTRVARAFKDVIRAPPLPGTDAVLHALCARLEIPERDRDARVAAARARAEIALADAGRRGLAALTMADAMYPAWLAQIADPPPVLWIRGPAPRFEGPAVAVVGSRHGTPVGLSLARHLGEGLARAGLVVVSGLARGVDGASHEGALRAGGATIAVLGCGADVVYPAEHRDLASRVAASGGVISELAPGTPPLPPHFPLRNRIISGLSRAVVVIEAGEKSGSLITAKMALEQGRDVLAVPGNVLSGRSRGCHALLKDGARLVETVEDVLDELGWRPAAENVCQEAGKSLPINDLVKAMTPGDVYDVDTLAEATGWTSSRLLAELTALEIEGRVVRTQGGWTRMLG